ncbi:hypothetical protein [Rhodopirellula europaea]|uniref:hypothetical protein n=1 Tax=Rhodopirellula europaea TaxID=1263866 RepID=UPI003D277B07
MLIKQLNGAQEGKDEEDDKGWSFNLCGACACDWDKGSWFNPGDGDLKITFNKTWVGQHIDGGKLLGTIKCRYQITGTIEVTVKKGKVVLASCKKKEEK